MTESEKNTAIGVGIGAAVLLALLGWWWYRQRRGAAEEIVEPPIEPPPSDEQPTPPPGEQPAAQMQRHVEYPEITNIVVKTPLQRTWEVIEAREAWGPPPE